MHMLPTCGDFNVAAGPAVSTTPACTQHLCAIQLRLVCYQCVLFISKLAPTYTRQVKRYDPHIKP